MNRTFPNFVVIGAAKSGTTSLHRYLRQHPDIFVANRREPSFFAHEGQDLDFCGPGDDEWAFVTDLEAYHDLFDDAEGHRAIGDISPRYLFFEHASARINHYVPDARIVVVLRHPVDRAYSHFLMNRSRQCEPEADFGEALGKEAERVARGWGWDWCYVGAGLYYKQLKRYYDLFPDDHIGVFLYDDLRKEPDTFFRDLFLFLGVDPTFQPDTSMQDRKAAITRSRAVESVVRDTGPLKSLLKRILPGKLRRGLKSKVMSLNSRRPPPLSDTTREQLFAQYFAADCAKLERLINRDLSLWTNGSPHAS